MTLAIWPLRLSFDLLGTYGGPQSNRVSFGTDSGIPIERPKYTAETELWNFVTEPMERFDVNIFTAWYRDTLVSGVSPFVLTHPMTEEFARWKIVDGSPPYTVRPISYELVTLSFQAMKLAHPVDQSAYYITADDRIGAMP